VAHHFHTDHPVFSCSKIEQKQLNTWVSFQSAEQPLLGQFSVSGNTSCIPREERRYVAPVLPRLRLPPRYGRFEVFIEMSSFRSSAVTRNFYPLHREPQLCGQQYCER
ncbi:hypothetical protein, partial [Pseudomonas sp. WS 5011]|uniref:hypothetical protein n=1 Tax=Pseudomonas sp. WS 5011 TaxID=2717477 RepID=UPI001CB713F7